MTKEKGGGEQHDKVEPQPRTTPYPFHKLARLTLSVKTVQKPFRCPGTPHQPPQAQSFGATYLRSPFFDL